MIEPILALMTMAAVNYARLRFLYAVYSFAKSYKLEQKEREPDKRTDDNRRT